MHTSGTQLYTLWRKQQKLRVRLVLVVIIILCLALWLKPHLFPQRATANESGTSPTTTKLTKGTPDFKTFVPAGKTIDSYGGWTRVSPSTSAAVYAYSDTIFGTGIIVSQQQLPDNFKNDPAHKIQQLQSDQAYVTQHTITADGTTVYIGTSNKSYQSTIFVKDDILVLITSYRSINDKAVADYILSLQ